MAENTNASVTVPLNQIPKGFLYRFDAWGKPFWQVLHGVTFGYPENPSSEDKERVRTLFNIIPYFLPCSICGLHFVKEMADKPLTDEILTSMESLSRWLVDLHNSVNVRLKKQVVTYEAARKYYYEDASVDPRGDIKSENAGSGINPMFKSGFWAMSVLVVLLLIVVVAFVILPRCTTAKK